MGLILATTMPLAACGQKGALYIPKTPAAAQRTTLPRTLFGRADAPPARPASAASAEAAQAPPAPALPDQPDDP